MFGYVRIDKPELKVKEYETYRGLYCSLCKAMGKHFGVLSRLTLSYDITFIVLLRLSLGGKIPNFNQGRCPFNPTKKCNYCSNGESELVYAAAVSMMMFYFKILDNINDSSFFKRLVMYLLLPYAKLKYKKAEKMYPQVAEIISEAMKSQSQTENESTDSIDKAAHASADALGRILAYNLEDERKNIYKFGYGVGKWVYLCDAADDIKTDIKKKSYNVFVLKYKLTDEIQLTQEIKKEIEYTLNMSSAFACEAFGKIENKTLSPIIENIIYGGMNQVMNNILKGKEKK